VRSATPQNGRNTQKMQPPHKKTEQQPYKRTRRNYPARKDPSCLFRARSAPRYFFSPLHLNNSPHTPMQDAAEALYSHDLATPPALTTPDTKKRKESQTERATAICLTRISTQFTAITDTHKPEGVFFIKKNEPLHILFFFMRA